MLKGCVIGLGAMGSNHVRVLLELQEEGKTKLIGEDRCLQRVLFLNGRAKQL